MIGLLLLILITSITYYLLKLNYEYWTKRGVNGPKPRWIIGNMGKSVIFQELAGTIYSKIYNQYQDEEIVGIYRATTPTIIARDPEFIKEVLVKSFNSFHDNDIVVDEKRDPIFGKNPFVLKGDRWKVVRSQLTPGFTSGKMKWLYPLLEEISEKLVKFIDSRPQTTNGEGYEAKELSVRFTLNNVASCAFGIDGKCFEEENSEFRQLSRDFFSPGSLNILLFTLSFMFPPISKYLPVKLVTKKVEDKLFEMVSQTLKYRDQNNIVRNDFLHILNELKKSSKNNEFTELDVTSHAAGFFGDGSETSSMVMSFVLFMLASNPEKQSKLREEVSSAYEENNSKFPYEVLQSLPYLDAVIQETLRIHPPILSLQKLCTQNFTYSRKNGKPVTIEKETPIILPLYALHHDSKYFEDPESFLPERFLNNNKDNLTNYAFLPFGEGPRACLGKRFGTLQIKSGVAHIIQNFELSVNKKTQLPIKYMATNALVTPIGGLWLDFKKIY